MLQFARMRLIIGFILLALGATQSQPSLPSNSNMQPIQRTSLLPFPMPEYEFAKLLHRIEIGTLRNAVEAGKNAVLFMQAVYSGQSGMPHICYHFKKILAQLTPVCEYCGKSPLPEEAVS